MHLDANPARLRLHRVVSLRTSACLTLLVTLLFSFNAAFAKGAVKLSTSNGLTLAFDSRTGRITQMVLGKVRYRGIGGFDARDIAADKSQSFEGVLRSTRKGVLEFRATALHLGLELQAKYTRSGRYIEVSGELRDASQRERAIVLTFTLPINAIGWRWWDDMRRGRTIRTGTYETVIQFHSRGQHSPYPLCAITSESLGLGLGIDMSLPVVHRFSYDADKHTLQLQYDFGLSPITKRPSTAWFNFVIFRVSEPGWGMRSAMADYYSIFPASFTKRVKREGIWLPFTPIRKIEHPEHFGFAFHEGTSGAQDDEQRNIYTFVYVEPWSARFYLPPGAPQELSPEAIFNHPAVRDAQKQEITMVKTSGVQSPEGKLHPRCYTADWARGKLIYDFLVNADPDLTGKVTKASIMDASIFNAMRQFEQRDVELDGVYFDGFGEWVAPQVNERREHWRAADFPLTFSWATKRPCQLGSFGIYEYVKSMAERLHPKGKLLMANGYGVAFPFAAHWLDVGGNEIHWTQIRDNYSYFDYRRFLSYQRPYLPLNNEDFQKVFTADRAREYFHWALFYGFFPSCFSPGASMHNNYWETPAFHNRDRWLFRIFIPLIRKLASAGWQPVTQGHPSSHEMLWYDVLDYNVVVERFGNYKAGNLHFAVHNRTDEPLLDTVQIDYKPLEIDFKEGSDLVVMELVTARMMQYDVDDMHINVMLTLPPRSTRLLWLAPRRQILHYLLTEVQRFNASMQKSLSIANASRCRELLDDISRAMDDALQMLSSRGHSKSDALIRPLARASGYVQRLIITLQRRADDNDASTIASELPIAYRVQELIGGAMELAANLNWVVKVTTQASPGDVITVPVRLKHDAPYPLENARIEVTLQATNGEAFAYAFHNWDYVKPKVEHWVAPRITVPHNTPDDTQLLISVTMRARIADEPITLKRASYMRVMHRFSMRAQLAPSAMGLMLNLKLTNNSSRAIAGKVRIRINDREARINNPLIVAPALATIDVARRVEPDDVKMGYYRATVEYQLPDGSVVTDEPSFIYIPSAHNRLGNASFERSSELGRYWQISKRHGEVTIDNKRAHDGKRSVVLTAKQRNAVIEITQRINVAYESAYAFVVSGFSVPSGVYPATVSDTYALKLVMDGQSNSQALTIPFDPRQARWQFKSAIGFATSPVQTVDVQLVLMERIGRVWFDDLFCAPFIPPAPNFARNATVSVDSSFTRYTPKPLNDGIGSCELRNGWWKVAWASAETPEPHWIELRFPRPVQVRTVVVWWALDKGKFWTSRRCLIQVWDDRRWETVAESSRNYDEPFTVYPLRTPVECKRLRVFQPSGGGNMRRPNLMWVAEVEVYE